MCEKITGAKLEHNQTTGQTLVYDTPSGSCGLYELVAVVPAGSFVKLDAPAIGNEGRQFANIETSKDTLV
jgi:hypothetical protein